MIGIIDYGMGNLASVQNALTHLGCEAKVLSTPADIGRYERLILPGVGSFAKAMRNLHAHSWPEALRASAVDGRPLLGICLGMQLLFDYGEEHGHTQGLGLIPGHVSLMSPAPPHRLPHVGWNNLLFTRQHAFFRGVKEHVDVYFVHSYHCVPVDEKVVLARCSHGGDWVASVERGCVAGMQFHPEKSQPAGLRILKNFTQWRLDDTPLSV